MSNLSIRLALLREVLKLSLLSIHLKRRLTLVHELRTDACRLHAYVRR